MFRISLVAIILLPLAACVTVTEGPTQNEKASKINVSLGVGYYQQGNLEMANEKLLKALRQDPDSSQAHHAYAVLQNRLLEKEEAEVHFRRAIALDSKNSEAFTNFGAFLCNDGKIEESEKMFLNAVDNPLYRTPEVAYTNAAVCLRKLDPPENERSKVYLTKALAARNNFVPALINLAELTLDTREYDLSRLYLDRYNKVTQPDARSIWAEIRQALAVDNTLLVDELAAKLTKDFSDSAEYLSWKALNQ